MPFWERILRIPRDKYLPAYNRKVPVPKNPTTIGGHLRRRRLQLKIFQSEAARKLGVSLVTMSKWECDKIYPTWQYHSKIIEYLAFDPFPSCGLRDPYGNEPSGVAILPSESLGTRVRKRRLELKLTVTECAQKLGIDVKTLRDWEGRRRSPCSKHRARIQHLVEVLA